MQTKVINLYKDKAELYCMYGKASGFEGEDPADYATRFKVKKENGGWKIDNIDTFDYNDVIKADIL